MFFVLVVVAARQGVWFLWLWMIQQQLLTCASVAVAQQDATNLALAVRLSTSSSSTSSITISAAKKAALLFHLFPLFGLFWTVPPSAISAVSMETVHFFALFTQQHEDLLIKRSILRGYHHASSEHHCNHPSSATKFQLQQHDHF